jgi:hypothetical protein
VRPVAAGSARRVAAGLPVGAVEVVGFRTTDELGQTCVIGAVHRGGSSVNNFNPSVLTAASSHTVGTITAGCRTETCGTGNEPTGFRLSSKNQDSWTFNWQAPNTAVGDVKFCLAGHEGSSVVGCRRRAFRLLRSGSSTAAAGWWRGLRCPNRANRLSGPRRTATAVALPLASAS